GDPHRIVGSGNRQHKYGGGSVFAYMVADAQHFSVKREHVVVVVLVCKAGIQLCDFASCEFIFVEQSLSVVNTIFDVGCPVRGLEGNGFAVKYLSVAARDIHYFNMASYVIAVRYEVIVGGDNNPDVSEDRLFNYIFDMGTDE